MRAILVFLCTLAVAGYSAPAFSNQIGTLGEELYEENTLWQTYPNTHDTVFSWRTGEPLSDGTLDIEIFGDLDWEQEYVAVYGENDTFLAQLYGGTELVTPHSYQLNIAQSLLEVWATDNWLSITFLPGPGMNAGLSFDPPQADYIRATLDYESGDIPAIPQGPITTPIPPPIILFGTGLVGLIRFISF